MASLGVFVGVPRRACHSRQEIRLGDPTKNAVNLTSKIKFSSEESKEKRAQTVVYGDFVGDCIMQLFGDCFINHDKDPYLTTSIMESKVGFFFCGLDVAGVWVEKLQGL